MNTEIFAKECFVPQCATKKDPLTPNFAGHRVYLDIRTVAQVSKPAVTPISKSAGQKGQGFHAFETRDLANLGACTAK
jgi:hypothetical protein